MEVEYQRDLLRQKKDHMAGVDRNYWNPIHHDDKGSFEMDDLKKLLSKVSIFDRCLKQYFNYLKGRNFVVYTRQIASELAGIYFGGSGKFLYLIILKF